MQNSSGIDRQACATLCEQAEPVYMLCRYAIAAGLFRANSEQERYLRCINAFAQHHCKHDRYTCLPVLFVWASA